MRKHASSCAVHNPPAFPAGPCDCGLSAPTVKPEQIPDAAAEAHARTLHDLDERSICTEETGLTYRAWEDVSKEEQKEACADSRAALAAAINAWPFAYEFFSKVRDQQVVGLPLPENTNDKA